MISEKEMMKHIQTVTCRYMPNCQNKHDRQSCTGCVRNEHRHMGYPSIDYYKEKIVGVKFF